MKTALSFILITVVTIFLEALFALMLWPLFVVVGVFFKTKDKFLVYLSAFVFGIIVDLVTGFPLGLSSLILLCFSVSLFAYSSRFQIDWKGAGLIIVVFQVIYIFIYNFVTF